MKRAYHFDCIKNDVEKKSMQENFYREFFIGERRTKIITAENGLGVV